MLTCNKDKKQKIAIHFFSSLIYRGDRHGIFIEENEESVASESDADSVSRKSSMESVMSDCSMTDVTRQQPEMSNKNCSMSESPAAATASPSASTAAAPTEGNNNSLPKEVSYAELELLKKLEEQNR